MLLYVYYFQNMTAFLPPNLIALFAPRDSIDFKPPVDDLKWERDRSKHPYSGIAQFVTDFDPPTETPPKVNISPKITEQLYNYK